MPLDIFILILNLASTWFMVGVIWFVQIVHYPLFGKTGTERFVEYQGSHQRLTTWVVAVPMLAEAATACLLVFNPPPVNIGLVLLAAGLLIIIWVSTALLQVPCHDELTRGFNAGVHRQLVLTNWLRTICWTLRGILLCWFVAASILQAGI